LQYCTSYLRIQPVANRNQLGGLRLACGLKLIGSRPLSTGIVILRYVPAAAK
jgi:hypothetical protein